MYSLSTNPGHKPFYVYVYLYLYLCLDRIRHQQQDYRKQFHPFLSICPLPHITCWPSVCPSCPSCLSVCAGTKRSRSGSVCSFNKGFFFYFMQIITLIMLLSTSFASCPIRRINVVCLRQNTHVSDILSNFPLIAAVSCQKAGILCFDDCLDHFLFFPCQDLLVPTPFLLTEWLLLRFSFSAWCWYKCCWNSNCKSKYRSTVFAYVTCTYMSCLPALKQEGQSASPNLSICLACLSLYPSICVFHIFVYDVGTLPKTACVCMHMHMAAAIVEVPVCTASYLQLCCSKVPSQEKRRGKLALFYF